MREERDVPRSEGPGPEPPGEVADDRPAAVAEQLSRVDRALARLGLRRARRLIIGILGVSVVLIGVLMVVLPGPAIVVIPAGLAILATEFLWAQRLLRRAFQTTLFAAGWIGIRDRIEAPLAHVAFRIRLIGRDELERQLAEARAAPSPTPLQRRRMVLAILVLIVLLAVGAVIGWQIVRGGIMPEAAPPAEAEQAEVDDA